MQFDQDFINQLNDTKIKPDEAPFSVTFKSGYDQSEFKNTLDAWKVISARKKLM